MSHILYRESVSPVPAAESRRLAMIDGISIVLDHAKRYDTPRALWASVLVAALTSWKASDRFACGGERRHIVEIVCSSSVELPDK